MENSKSDFNYKRDGTYQILVPKNTNFKVNGTEMRNGDMATKFSVLIVNGSVSKITSSKITLSK